MSDQTLAQFSMLSLYSAMGVLTLAMLAFAAHLAWLLPARDEAAIPPMLGLCPSLPQGMCEGAGSGAPRAGIVRKGWIGSGRLACRSEGDCTREGHPGATR